MNVFSSQDPGRCIVSSDPGFAARLAAIVWPDEDLVQLTLQDETTGEITYMVVPVSEQLTVVK
jgi:hypothetical protein